MLLDDVATYIVAQSTKFTLLAGSAGNLAKSKMMDTITPDTTVALYETGGTATAQSFSTGTGATVEYEQPGLQVLSRSTNYQTARNNAQTIFTMLDGFTGTLPTATGPVYLSIDANQSPFPVGPDANGRWLISLNFNIRKAIG